MKQFEIPIEIVYKVEKTCPFSREVDRDNLFSRSQWFFEKHYEQSSFNYGIPFRERFSFNGGFEQYLYFKWETDCPFSNVQSGAATWWHFERSHWNA